MNKNDGKNVNPATNLLPQKSKDSDDEDWDDDADDSDSESMVNTNRMNKDINKAVKISQKDMAPIRLWWVGRPTMNMAVTSQCYPGVRKI